MRLLIAAPDLPYPPNSGGRADVWRRLRVMASAGAEIFFIAWFDAHVDRAARAEAAHALSAHTVATRFFPIHRGVREALVRLTLLPRAPSHAASRRIETDAHDELLYALRAFDPNLVWIEGLWPAFTARRLARTLGIQYVYRSHNIEHRYMAGQAREVRHWRDSLALRVATVGVNSFELSVLRDARWVFDISQDDLVYWQRHNIRHNSLLLPFPGTQPRILGTPAREASRDVVFFGNLHTPNNISGVEWLLREIRPIVQRARPTTRWTLAGSAPVPYIRDLTRTAGQVELLENVADPYALLNSARVLVNPVRTGSGLMIKTLDMLMTDAPIVTTPQGVAGLPSYARATFRVGITTGEFARAILEELAHPSVDTERRAQLRAALWQDGGAAILRELERIRTSTHRPLDNAAWRNAREDR